jgi:hypothetical protein
MDWIKRNLIFVVGSALALGLLGAAGWYLYSGVSKNDAALEALNQQYNELGRLNRQNPHPGNDKTDNIAAAKDQEKQVRTFIGKVARVFEPIPSIPDTTNVNNALLAESLRRTLDRLQRDAGNAGVQLPDKYAFSFSAIRPLLVFDQAGLAPLATQLGEVKAICDVLFTAKINALDGIRRQRVCTHDREAQQTTDYTERPSVTNEVAVITPYEVTIRCFSSELGSLLAGYASSRHGLLVKAVNVEPALATGAVDPMAAGGFQPVPVQPVYTPVPAYRPPALVEEGLVAPRPMIPAPVYAAPPPAGTTRGGLPVLLDEKQIKVTLLIEVIKLTPKN